MEENIKDTMTAKVVKEIKDVDNNVTGVIVPILRDTVTDYRKIVNKLVVIIVILILCLISLGVIGHYMIAKQIDKYNEFLSQFDFESTVYQDTDDNSSINSGININ